MKNTQSLAVFTSEDQVAQLWQDFTGRPDLVTEEGLPLRIISPGRVNKSGGPDIIDAVISLGGQQLSGDIEIHTVSSGWHQHGHDLDPAYNRVILHVVLDDGKGEPVVRQDGRHAVTIVLGRFATGVLHEPIDTVPCRNVGHVSLGRLLDRCGDVRFRIKAEQFQKILENAGPEQILYTGVMDALGYARNRAPFKELAGRVPLRLLRAITGPGAIVRRQAFLLGAAGMLPVRRDDRTRFDTYSEELGGIWSRWSGASPMARDEWRPGGVRMGNLPGRRMAAMSYLAEVLSVDEIAFSGIELSNPRDLVRSLMVPADDYWRHHFDLGRASPSSLPHLLGAARAADIVVNVLLPFALARFLKSGDKARVRKVMDSYHQFPRLQSNSIEAHMSAQIGLGTDTVNGARRQQGLLHLYKEYCVRGVCPECPVAAGIIARRYGRAARRVSG